MTIAGRRENGSRPPSSSPELSSAGGKHSARLVGWLPLVQVSVESPNCIQAKQCGTGSPRAYGGDTDFVYSAMQWPLLTNLNLQNVVDCSYC